MIGAALFFGSWAGAASVYKGSRFGKHLIGIFLGSLVLLVYIAAFQGGTSV